MIILGIDPGIQTVGLGIVESVQQKHKAVDWCVIHTDSHTNQAIRLQEIATDLTAYIQEYKPELAVIEKIFMNTNQKTAIQVAEARGVLLLQLANAAIPCIEITPLQLKQAITGDGKADKKQVQTMIMRDLQLTEIPTPDDAADALALALFGGMHHKMYQL